MISPQLWYFDASEGTVGLSRADLKERQARARDRLVAEALLYNGLTSRQCSVRREKNGRLTVAGADNLFFSLSHRKQRVVLLYSHQPCGVDIELIDSTRVSREAAELFMHPLELNLFEQSVRPLAFFYAVWTAKEAWFKALSDEEQKSYNMAAAHLPVLIQKASGDHYSPSTAGNFEFRWAFHEGDQLICSCVAHTKKGENKHENSEHPGRPAFLIARNVVGQLSQKRMRWLKFDQIEL